MEEITDGINLRGIFSANLKRLRSRMNMSQLDLAVNAGLAANYINDIENGKKWPSDKTIVKLTKVLKTEPYQLFIPLTMLEINGVELFLEDLSDSILLTVKERFNHYTAHNPPQKTGKKENDKNPRT